MFEIDENSLPFVHTRQALLLLDLQNDFISTGGILPVDQPSDFLDRTFKLLPEFRASGNVIWVRSVFEESRTINEPVGDSESVITDNELPTARDGDAHLRAPIRPSQRLIEQHKKVVETNGIRVDGDNSIEVDDEEEEEEEEDSGEVEETYLTLRPKQLPKAVLPTSPGTNFSQSASMRIDGKKDLIFQKSWYSAFKDGNLVQILRAKFVTEIYLCGALTNISVFATAMDAARHGYTITIVQDCLGYRSKARHDEALRRLVEFAGCDIINSEDLIEELQQKARKLQAAPKPKPKQYQRPQPKSHGSSSKSKSKSKSTGIENLLASMNLNLRPNGIGTSPPPPSNATPTGHVPAAETDAESLTRPSEAQAQDTTTKPTDQDGIGKKRERVKAKIKTRRRHSKSIPKEVTEASSADTSSTSATLIAATQALEKLPNSFLSTLPSKQEPQPESLPAAKVHSDSSDVEVTPPPMASKSEDAIATPVSYCEGDTTVIYNLLDEQTADGVFEYLRDEVRWQRMSHQGGDVPRLVAVQGEHSKHGDIPIYRHPADESPPLLPFSPTVSLIRKQVEKKLGHAVNHVLIQFYRDGTDHITEHSDKTLDIVRDTFICNVSLGAQRTMTFRTKRPLKGSPEATAELQQPRQVQKVPLPHNSMVKVGLATNMKWLHAIRPDKRMDSEKSTEELAYDCGRISLTFRLIGTYLSKDESKIWGQGAVSKSKNKANLVINGDAAESEKLIRAFSKENFSSEFDWEAVYGPGFDVLHISNTPKLILSGDDVADLRVKVMLAEYDITWLETKSSTDFNWKDSKNASPTSGEPIKFIDNDTAQSTVIGDIAIILYLDSVCGPKISANGPDLAKQFTRLQQANELLRKWHIKPFVRSTFRAEIGFWDSFAKEGPYIAGSTISIADFAVWPVLEIIKQEWKTIEGLDHLVKYYDQMRDREAFVKVLGPREVVKAPETEAKAVEP